MSKEQTILEKAAKLYNSYIPEYRNAALELFTEEELEEASKTVSEDRQKELISKLQKKIDRCKTLFPIGTLINSDDSIDHCPHLVCGEPYIANDEKWVSKFSDYDYNDKERKSIFVKTLRISDGKAKPSFVCLENVLGYHTSKNRKMHMNMIIDPNERYKEECENRDQKVMLYKGKVQEFERELEFLKKDLETWKKYEPVKMDKEFCDKILKTYEESHK